jgi:hypothetical protein
MMRRGQKIWLWSGALSLVAILQAGFVPALRGQQMPAMPNEVRKQLSTPVNPPAPAKSAPSSNAKQTPAPQNPSSATAKPAQPATSTSAAKPAAQTKGQSPNPPAKSAPATAAAGTPVAQAKPAEREPARRDPFQSLVKNETNGPPVPDKLPPGKAGLVIATLRVDGIVRSPNGMIVVVSNPQERVYFLRQGDQLFDGQVERVDMDGVLFHQTGQDAFGKPIEREVTKRLYPTPGEQQ